MTRVDFYLLPRGVSEGRPMYACRLAEKAYGLGHRVYIHTGSPADTERLDELLWTFRQGSFVPHAAAGEDAEVPVVIGHEETRAPDADVLINLTNDVPEVFTRFERVAELVDDDGRERARARFRRYREHGCDVTTHELTGRG